MVSRVKISVASGRGGAERWRSTYYHKTNDRWGVTVSGNAEDTYNALCALGPNPLVEAVAGIIGNQSWTHLNCSGCGEYVTRAANFGCDHSDGELRLCEPCLKDGLDALSRALNGDA